MALASRRLRRRLREVLWKRGVLSASTMERLKMRLWRQYDCIREDQEESCDERVEATGWRVKKGGKEKWGGNWNPFVVGLAIWVAGSVEVWLKLLGSGDAVAIVLGISRLVAA
jgi:hypothetical protein